MMHQRVFQLLIFVLFVHHTIYSNAQKANLVTKGKSADPSFYDICKWSENEYLVGGENGTVFILDTSGKISNAGFTFPKDYHILRLIEADNLVLLGATNGIVAVIDKESDCMTSYQSKSTSKFCNYDLLALNNNSFLSCGGSSGVAKGKPALPSGFIASYNLDDSSKVVSRKVSWRRFNSFVWCFLKIQERNEIYAVVYLFPGNKSLLLRSVDNGQTWQKHGKIKGLVHQISYIDSNIYYAGCKNPFYYRDGIIGNFSNAGEHHVLKGSGCVYDIQKVDDKIIGCTFKGALITWDANKNPQQYQIQNKYPIYEMISIENGKLFTIGHGGSIFVIDF